MIPIDVALIVAVGVFGAYFAGIRYEQNRQMDAYIAWRLNESRKRLNRIREW